MAQETAKGYLLTDTEAAAIRRWAQKVESTRPNIHNGYAAVGDAIDRSRVHINYVLTPTTKKRVPINADDLAAVVRMLLSDRKASYELRRVAEDNVQAIIDAVQEQGAGRVVMEGTEGVMVLIPRA